MRSAVDQNTIPIGHSLLQDSNQNQQQNVIFPLSNLLINEAENEIQY